jgi:outer membrane biosynthesis protein TonB
MKLDGTVKVSVAVASNGNVKSVQAVGVHPLLLKTAQDAVTKWKWAPASEESQEFVELRFHPN